MRTSSTLTIPIITVVISAAAGAFIGTTARDVFIANDGIYSIGQMLLLATSGGDREPADGKMPQATFHYGKVASAKFVNWNRMAVESVFVFGRLVFVFANRILDARIFLNEVTNG